MCSTTNRVHECTAQESFIGPEKAEEAAAASSVPCCADSSLSALGGQAPGEEGGLQPPRQEACLSSDYGSEGNDAFPNALALGNSACSAAAAAPSQPGSPQRSSLFGVFRRKTNNNNNNSNPAGTHGAPPRREDTARARCGQNNNTNTEEEPENKADAQRIAVPSRPSDPRPSGNGLVSRARDVSRKLSELMGVAGARVSCAGSSAAGSNYPTTTTTTTTTTTVSAAAAALDWKPHENILKVLGYRPRGHGQRFIDRYKLGETLGTGGFGVVREGE